VQHATRDVWITAEAPLPECITDHTDEILALRVFTFDKGASEQRADAEDFEEVGADTGHWQTFRFAVAGKIDGAVVVESDRFERTILFAIGSEVSLRHSPRCEAEFRTCLDQSHYAIGLTKRQRSQQNAVHETEDRGVGADAERECDDRNERDRRLLQQNARAITKILE